jgi:hypothetical protein
MALSRARAIYGKTFNPQITLKALSFFDDFRRDTGRDNGLSR